MSDLNSELNRDIPRDIPLKKMYKYTSFDRALDILMRNRIYFAKLSEFNDPFERLVTLDSDTPEGRRTLIENMVKKARERWPNMSMAAMTEEQKQEFVNNPSAADRLNRAVINELLKDSTGFCCLTNTCQSLPMWAHYANSHTGCCLMFDFSKYPDQKMEENDFPFHYMTKIKYGEKLPKYNMGRLWIGYSYKSIEWQYENEWRAVMYDKDIASGSFSNPVLIKKSNGANFYPLGKFLREVILGYKMNDTHKMCIMLAAKQRNISVRQASPELYKYGIRLTEVDGKQLNQV